MLTTRPAVLYARVSPRPRKRKPGRPRPQGVEDSCDAQLGYCRRYCELYGYHIIAEFTDRRLSGKNARRPAFRKAVRLAREKRAVLVAYSMSRLVRNTELACKLLRILTKEGAALAAVVDHIDTTSASGRCWFRFRAAMDEFEREQTAERTSHVMRAYQAGGRRMGSKAPLGWMIDPDNADALIPNQDEQDALARMAMLRAEGMGFRAIGRALESEGVLCRGKPWNHVVIARQLAKMESRPAQ